jgi:hypothetical protein
MKVNLFLVVKKADVTGGKIYPKFPCLSHSLSSDDIGVHLQEIIKEVYGKIKALKKDFLNIRKLFFSGLYVKQNNKKTRLVGGFVSF